MEIRTFAVSLSWTLLVGLMLLSIQSTALNLGASFDARFSFQYFCCFALLTYSICISLKKQTKSSQLKSKTYEFALLLTFGIIILVEILSQFIYPMRAIQWFWDSFGILGSFFGIGMFHLLYNDCC